MFAALTITNPLNGKGGLTPVSSLFPFEADVSAVNLQKFLADFPQFAPRIVLTLALLSVTRGTVTPFRLCACGCGASVTGKARFAGADCRKRRQRERDALRSASGDRQYQIPLQAELGTPLPPNKL